MADIEQKFRGRREDQRLCLNLLNALRTAGVRHFDMPATPARIWSAIATANAAHK